MNAKTYTIDYISGDEMTAEGSAFDQLLALDGRDQIFLATEDIHNGSGRVVGERVTVSADTARLLSDPNFHRDGNGDLTEDSHRLATEWAELFADQD